MNRTIASLFGGVGVCVILYTIGCTKKSTPPPASTTDSTVNLTKGLLVYLPFSNSIADSSGNNNPTRAVGSVLTYDEHGYANSAFGATGHGEKIYVTNNGSIKFDTAYSVSFGFSVDTNGTVTYVSMVDPTSGRGPTFDIGTTLPAAPKRLDFGSEDISLGCENYGASDNINLTDTSAFIPVPHAWYNLIAIYHKGSIQVYINGKLLDSKTGLGTKALLCPSSQILIGAWWDSDPQYFSGKIDNFRLYNRVLTPHEIASLSSSYQITSNSVAPVLHTN